jgi:hypothetical protein
MSAPEDGVSLVDTAALFTKKGPCAYFDHLQPIALEYRLAAQEFGQVIASRFLRPRSCEKPRALNGKCIVRP